MNSMGLAERDAKGKSFSPSVVSVGVSLILLTAVFSLMRWINPAWTYSSIGWVDAWAYVGHAIDPVGMRSAFPNAPSGDLLPLIWPPALLYSIFSPAVANLVYKWASFALAGLLLYRMVEKDFGRQTAVWATMALIFYKYFLIAVGSDYTDGRVVLYLMLALYFLSTAHAGDVRPRGEKARLFLGGLFFSFSVSTAFLSFVFGLPLALFGMGRQWIKRGKVGVGLLALPVAGFFAGILLLGFAHFLYTGRFLYFEATLAKTSSFLQTTRGPQVFKIRELEWIYLPALACIGLPLSLLAERGRNTPWGPERKLSVLLWIVNVTAMVPLAYLQYVKQQETLTNCFYFDQILPFAALAIAGTLIHPALRHLSGKWFTLATGIFFLVCLAVFGGSTVGPPLHAAWLHILVYTGGGIAILLFCIVGRDAGWIAVFLTCFLGVNLSPVKSELLSRNDGLGPWCRSRKQILEASLRWIALVQEVDPTRSRYLWYNCKGDCCFLRGFSASSHLWQYRILNECLPELDVPMGECGIIDPAALISQRRGLILITRDDAEAEAARNNLLKRGIRAECESSTTFAVNGEKSLQIRICRLEQEKRLHGSRELPTRR